MKVKESFLLYASQKEPIFSLLDIRQRGILLTALYCYASSCDLPKMDDKTLMAFRFIKSSIDYNNGLYEDRVKKQSEGGKKGARHRAEKQAQLNAERGTRSTLSIPKHTQSNPSIPKHNDMICDDTICDDTICDDTICDDTGNEDKSESIEESGDAFASTSPSKKFIPPTAEQVEEYCSKKGFQIDVRLFMDYYTANGWKVGKNPMRDWKAAVRTWENRARTGGGHISRGKTGGGIMEQMERLYHAESDSLLPRGISSSEEDEGA